MTKTYYVIDSEDSTLWQGKQKDDAPQVFKSFAAAEKRAKEAAGYEPGKQFKIAGVEAIVECDVGDPKTKKLA